MPPLYPWQREALAAWEHHRRRGIIEAVTGAGKTVLGITAAHQEIARGGKVVILVPTVDLLNQWVDKLADAMPTVRIGMLGGGHADDLALNDVLVAVVNSARTRALHPGGSRGLLIADECHRCGAEANASALEEDFPARLGLSATYERSDDGHLVHLIPYFGGVRFRLGYKRAIEEGAICRFSVHFVGVDFAPGELRQYEEQSARAAKLRGKLIRHYGVTAEPFGEFMKQVQQLKEGGADEATGLARGYLAAFSKKRQVLANATRKIDALTRLKDAIECSRRTIVFTQTIETALKVVEKLCGLGIKAEAVHSQMPAEQRTQGLRRFKEGTIKAIVAPQVLDEGVDVPAADVGIIVSASATRRQMIQRMGRVLRRDHGKSGASFYILYARGTSEDPEIGAHEDFIEDIVDVADSVEDF